MCFFELRLMITPLEYSHISYNRQKCTHYVYKTYTSTKVMAKNKKCMKIPNVVIRSRKSKDRQYNDKGRKKQKDKHQSTKHYTEQLASRKSE